METAEVEGAVDFEKADHLDWPVRTRENLGSMGYGPRFRQDRGRGYASRYLLDKPLDSVGPQVRSDWVSPGSIDFGTCTRFVVLGRVKARAPYLTTYP